MITAFGKFLRELRHLHAELMKDMADNLQVSSAFLSSVESGKKNIPPTWLDSLRNLYKLSPQQVNALNDAFNRSQKNAMIDLSNESEKRREIAVTLARTFNDLSDEQLDTIKRAMFSTKKRGDNS
ncbi:MAG TPA: helix-turn-helix transcriptional regulator [Herbaspirillum sp.]|uniref:helix-turn-helix domain-containing protein n=1 Tax=Herbaspirillum sp. TaxID=1890675 RepID=UPI002D246869|nr:helix-turn-helix transcriptional regulator [Herbaspirillum sp.]HZG20588.1 helix-turn-helix transcriptional regulator [Herbaspirillum sp.]